MEIYAQHGSKKSDKIDSGLQESIITGVILSPRDIKQEDVPRFIERLKTKSKHLEKPCEILFDPQFYVSTLDGTHKFGHGPTYPFFRFDLSRSDFRSSRKKVDLIKSCLEYQELLSVQHIVAPNILVEGFSDFSSEIALELCQSSIETHSEMGTSKDLVLSIVVSESAFHDPTDLSYFLDELTDLRNDISKLYILIKRQDRTFPATIQPEVYSRILYFVDCLINKNQFEVVVGYSDIFGLAFHALGAKATASGWSQGQRQLTMSQWQPDGFGSQPKLKYLSAPLLSQLIVDTEMRTIRNNLNQIRDVLSNNRFDSIFEDNYQQWGMSWNHNLGHLNNWTVLNALAKELSLGTTEANLAALLTRLQNAMNLWNSLSRNGVTFESQSGLSRLKELKEGIDLFIKNFS